MKKKFLILFASTLSLSIIFAAGWASGKNVDASTPNKPASVQSEEQEKLPPANKGVQDMNTEDDDYNVNPDGGRQDDHHRPMPRFRFKNLVLPGITPRQP